jgi:tetratricopeptide (TPR) repeat protein
MNKPDLKLSEKTIRKVGNMLSVLIRTRVSKVPTHSIRSIRIFPLVVLMGVYVSMVLSCSSLSIDAQAQAQDDESSARVQRGTSSAIAIEEDNSPTCLELGMELYFEQKYDEAIDQLEQCISEDPDNPEIYYYIGQSYFQQGQQAARKNDAIKATRYFRQAYPVSDTAIEKYSQRIEESPDEDHTNDYLRLAYIYQIRSLIPGIDEYQKALAIYEQLLTEKPYLTYTHYQMGWIYFQKKDYQDAIDSFLAYLKRGRRSAFAYYHLGLSYAKIGEKEKAEHYFQLILNEFPDSEMAQLARKELKKY